MTHTKGAPVKKTKKAELPLPDIAFGCVWAVAERMGLCK